MEYDATQGSTQSYSGVRGRSRRRTASRQPSRSRSAVRASPFRGFGARIPRIKLNYGVHKFQRTVSTNLANALSGGGPINITTSTIGGFKVAEGLTSGVAMCWAFTLGGPSMQIFAANGTLIYTQTYGLPAAAEFVALFDDFRIDSIECTMNFNRNFQGNSSIATQNSGFGMPNIGYFIDTDDAAATTLGAAQQRESYRNWSLAQTPERKVTWKPKANMTFASADGTAVVGFGQFSKSSPFLDTAASINTPYFGLKLVMDNPNPTTSAADVILGQINFNFVYHMSFKTVK